MNSLMQYKKSFYRSLESQGLNSAREILPFIVNLLAPQSVVDVGCGTGEWLSVCMELGIEDIQGVDFYDGSFLKIPRSSYLQKDLNQPFTIPRTFDLAVSLEVGEHLSPESAKEFVCSLTRLAPAVLFSAAIPGQGGTGHINLQWPDYWAELFEAFGFTAADCIRPQFWQNPKVACYYAQNIVLYVKDREIDLPSFKLQRFVHPEMWEGQASELSLLRPLYTARGLVKRLPGALWNSITARVRD